MTFRTSDSERAPSRSRHRRWAVRLGATALAAVLASTFVAGPAFADPTPAEKETARNLVKTARAKIRDGDLASALEDLKAAHAIMNVATTGLELGKAQVKAGQLVEARDTLLAVVRQRPDKIEPYAFRKARAAAKKLSDDVAKRVPTLHIEVIGEGSADTRVAVDGVKIAPAALQAPLSLNPGPHVITLSKGGSERTTEVTLEESQTRDVVLDATGLSNPEGKDEQKPLVVEPKSETNPLVWVGFSVAGAGVVVGSITGLMAISKHSDVVSRCTDNLCPPDTHDDIDSGQRLGTISTISFVIAGIGAGVGVYGLLNPKSDEKQPKVGVWVGPGSAQVRGRF
jgi:hypothetical protein